MQAVTITQISPNELETLIENSIKKFLGSSKQENHNKADELLTRKQAAGFLQICLPKLDELVLSGEIPAGRIGSRVRFLKSELIESLPKIKGSKAA